jgi:hypothetical protein
MLAGPAGSTGAAGEAGIEDDVIAQPDRRHIGADGRHHAGAVGTHDVREVEREARHAAEDEEVEMIESGGLQRDDHLAGAGLGGPGHVLQLQLFRAAMGPDRHGHHGPEI